MKKEIPKAFDSQIQEEKITKLWEKSQLGTPEKMKALLKANGVDIKEKADRTIMFGEKGFLKRPEMQQIVKKVKMEREKQITDIFFVKVENTTKLCDEPITLEIEYRGKITGYFSRSSFTQDQARKIICNFFDKFGV